MDLLNECNNIFQKSVIPYAALQSGLCSYAGIYPTFVILLH